MFQLFDSVKNETIKENLKTSLQTVSDSIVLKEISIDTPNGETIVPSLSLKVYLNLYLASL
jgi:hypothetical protein